MKRRMARVIVLGIVVVMALAVVPSTTALTGYGVEFANAYWSQACRTGFGRMNLDWTVNIPIGYTVKQHFERYEPSLGGFTGDLTWVETSGWKLSLTDIPFFLIENGGWGTETYEVYEPGGLLINTSQWYASCVTGEVWARSGELATSIFPPDPSARVQADVLYDTPVFAQPDPGTALDDTLLAGQQWFVVAETTGTDGKLWYEVFVGGPHNAYVPAAALSLPGPIP